MSTLTSWKVKWQSLQQRERWMIGAAALVVLGALLWVVALRPAWQTNKTYLRDKQALEQQIERMQSMRQQALALQSQLATSSTSASSPSAVTREIQTSAQRFLGETTQVTPVGDRITVRLQHVAATAVLQWLQESRNNTRSTIAQLDLKRGPAQANAETVYWSGQVVIAVPPQP